MLGIFVFTDGEHETDLDTSAMKLCAQKLGWTRRDQREFLETGRWYTL